MQQRSHAGRLSSSRRHRPAAARAPTSAASAASTASPTAYSRGRTQLHRELEQAIAANDTNKVTVIVDALSSLFAISNAAPPSPPSTPTGASSSAAGAADEPAAPKRNARSYSAAAGAVNAHPTQLFESSPEVDIARRRRAKRARLTAAGAAVATNDDDASASGASASGASADGGASNAGAGDGWIDPSALLTVAPHVNPCATRRSLTRCGSVARGVGVRGTGTAGATDATTDGADVANTTAPLKRYPDNDVLALSSDDDDDLRENPHFISDDDDDDRDRRVLSAVTFDSLFGRADSMFGSKGASAVGDDSSDPDFDASDSGGESSTEVSDNDEVIGDLGADSPPLILSDPSDDDDDTAAVDATVAYAASAFSSATAAASSPQKQEDDTVTDFEFDVPNGILQMAKSAAERTIRRRIETAESWKRTGRETRWPGLPYFDMTRAIYSANSPSKRVTMLEAMGTNCSTDRWGDLNGLVSFEPSTVEQVVRAVYDTHGRDQRDAETVRITLRNTEPALCFDTYRVAQADGSQSADDNKSGSAKQSAGDDNKSGSTEQSAVSGADDNKGSDAGADDKREDTSASSKTVEFDFSFPVTRHQDFSTPEMAKNATRSGLHITRDDVDSFAFFWYTLYIGSKGRAAVMDGNGMKEVLGRFSVGGPMQYMSESEARLLYLLHRVEHVDINMVCSRMFKHYAYHPVFIAGMAMMMKWCSSYNAQNNRLFAVRDAWRIRPTPMSRHHSRADPNAKLSRSPSHVKGKIAVRATGETFVHGSMEFHEKENKRNTNAWPVTMTCADWSAHWMLKTLPYITGTVSNVDARFMGMGSGRTLNMSVSLLAATGESRALVDDSDFREPERKFCRNHAKYPPVYARVCQSPFDGVIFDEALDANLPGCPLVALNKALALQGIRSKTGTTDIKVKEVAGNVVFSESFDGSADAPSASIIETFADSDFFPARYLPLDYFSKKKGVRCAPQPMVYARQAELDGYGCKAFGNPTIFTLFYPMDTTGRLFLPITFSRAHLCEITKLKKIDEDALIQDIRQTRGEAAAAQATSRISSATTDAIRQAIAQDLAKTQLASAPGSHPPGL